MKLMKFGSLSVAAVMVCALVMAQDRPLANPGQEQPGVRPEQPGVRPNDQRGQPVVRPNDMQRDQLRNDAQRDQPRAGQAGVAQGLDSHIANCLVLGNQEEIALAKWAMERTQNAQVKDFAQKLVNEHQQALAKLQPFSGRSDVTNAANIPSGNVQDRLTVTNNRPVSPPDETGAARPAPRNEPFAQQPGDTQRVNAVATAMDTQKHQLERATMEECLRLTKECLGKEQGSRFDNAFIGHQIGMHIGMLAKLNASQNVASPELRRVIEEGQTMAKHHKEHAEQLMTQLDKGNASNDAARPATR